MKTEIAKKYDRQLYGAKLTYIRLYDSYFPETEEGMRYLATKVVYMNAFQTQDDYDNVDTIKNDMKDIIDCAVDMLNKLKDNIECKTATETKYEALIQTAKDEILNIYIPYCNKVSHGKFTYKLKNKIVSEIMKHHNDAVEQDDESVVEFHIMNILNSYTNDNGTEN